MVATKHKFAILKLDSDESLRSTDVAAIRGSKRWQRASFHGYEYNRPPRQLFRKTGCFAIREVAERYPALNRLLFRRGKLLCPAPFCP